MPANHKPISATSANATPCVTRWTDREAKLIAAPPNTVLRSKGRRATPSSSSARTGLPSEPPFGSPAQPALNMTKSDSAALTANNSPRLNGTYFGGLGRNKNSSIFECDAERLGARKITLAQRNRKYPSTRKLDSPGVMFDVLNRLNHRADTSRGLVARYGIEYGRPGGREFQDKRFLVLNRTDQPLADKVVKWVFHSHILWLTKWNNKAANVGYSDN